MKERQPHGASYTTEGCWFVGQALCARRKQAAFEKLRCTTNQPSSPLKSTNQISPSMFASLYRHRVVYSRYLLLAVRCGLCRWQAGFIPPFISFEPLESVLKNCQNLERLSLYVASHP